MYPLSIRALCVLLVFTGGCSTWAVSTAPVAETIATHGEIHVSRTSGWTTPVYEPQLRGDTLVGFQRYDAREQVPIAIPRSDITSIAVQQFSAGRTVLLVVGLGAVAVVALAAAALSHKPTFNGGFKLPIC